MNRRTRCITTLFLATALSAPAALCAGAAQQRDDRQQGRVYDPQHRDYHDWNDNEERAYRQFLSETHRDYREYARLDERSQGEYWNWRHGHPDRDDRGDKDRGARGPARYYDDNGRDWHDWNDNEDRAYREYLGERHRDYVEFGLLVPRDQQEYWVWRHGHPDRDDRDNHGNGNGQARRYYDQNTGQYHDWNDNEDRAYRRFIEENHRQYVDFDHADLSIQLQFWLWRQFHPDGEDRPAYRYYDDDRHERHEWNEREEGSYRSFLISISRPYVEFSVASPDIQLRYWSWRHDHPDADDHGPRRYLDARRNEWHVWDDREDRAYRIFMNERHWPYRELYILLPRDQQRYWDWRRSHSDRDIDRH